MKKEEIPHDPGALAKITREICYAVDDSGKYTAELSEGWEVKAKALDIAWQDVQDRIAAARQKVLNNEASPLLFFMELRLMDIDIKFAIGKLNIIAGPTGSGKTSLLMALLGEMTKIKGQVFLPGGYSREDVRPYS